MINNKDRLQTGDIPNSMPLGYALKGRCLSNADLHHLINTVRNKLKEHKIDILVECYDGQWQLTVMTTEKGEPLNEMRVAQATWSRISKLSKHRIMDEMKSCNSIKLGDLDLLRYRKLPVGVSTYENIELTKNKNGSIEITSLGGQIFKKPCARFIATPTDPELWEKKTEEPVAGPVRDKKISGLKASEINILSTLPADIVAPFLEDGLIDSDNDKDFLPELQTIQPQLRQLLLSDNFNLLQDIVVELKEYDKEKWAGLTVADMFPDMLRDAKVLMSKCVKEELGMTGNILHSYAGKAFFSLSFLKVKNANPIARAFEGISFVQQIRMRKTTPQNRNPCSLVEACTKILLQKSHLILPVQVAYAKIANWVSMSHWIKAS